MLTATKTNVSTIATQRQRQVVAEHLQHVEQAADRSENRGDAGARHQLLNRRRRRRRDPRGRRPRTCGKNSPADSGCGPTSRLDRRRPSARWMRTVATPCTNLNAEPWRSPNTSSATPNSDQAVAIGLRDRRVEHLAGDVRRDACRTCRRRSPCAAPTRRSRPMLRAPKLDHLGRP